MITRDRRRRILLRSGEPPELVFNGTFDANVDGWTGDDSGGGNTVVWDASGAMSVNGGSYPRAFQTVNVVAGKTYEVSADVTQMPGGSEAYVSPEFGTDFTTTTTGTVSFDYTATAGTMDITVGIVAANAGPILFDNISIKLKVS